MNDEDLVKSIADGLYNEFLRIIEDEGAFEGLVFSEDEVAIDNEIPTAHIGPGGLLVLNGVDLEVSKRFDDLRERAFKVRNRRDLTWAMTEVMKRPRK